jgi:hypothetical protein
MVVEKEELLVEGIRQPHGEYQPKVIKQEKIKEPMT